MIHLMSHQQRFVEICADHPNYCWWAAPGVGKTIGTAAVICDAKHHGFQGKTVVICPKSIMGCAWLSDLRHFPDLKAVICWNPVAAKRRKLIATPGADVLIINPACFKSHVQDFLDAGVTRLVIDESSCCKNITTQMTKAAMAFARKMKSVYLLSGTPAANGPHEYIPQLMIADPSVFGGSYWPAMYRYFAPIKRSIEGVDRVIGWKPIASMKDEFHKRLQTRSWSLTKEECLDLPEQVDVEREVVLGAEEANAYISMLEDLKIELGDGDTLNAGCQARLMKLRQITGGGVYYDGQSRTLGNSKIDELKEVLDEIGNRQVVVWAEFTNEIDRILAAVHLSGRSAKVIDGRTVLDDRTEAVERFQRGELDCIVAHPAAAGHGITLTAACYCVYYSHSFSFETYQQSRDRIHRKGQQQKCTYYHLVAAGTVDERILAALRTKQSAHESVMAMLQQHPPPVQRTPRARILVA